MNFQNKDITVLLLLYQTPLNVLKNLKIYQKFNILILDQSNDKNLKKKIKKILPNIKYYKITNKNKGFAYGINYLAKKVNTKYFLCTQPDVKISQKSILLLKNVFLKKKDCIISIPDIKSFINYNASNRLNNNIFSVYRMIGAVFLCEKKKFININKFDENFFFYWEDIDLSERIKKSKFKIYMNYKSKAIHLGGKSSKHNFNNLFIKSANFKYGEYLFQYKHEKLRFIKIPREFIKNLIILLFNLSTLRFENFLKYAFYNYGIIKFIKFYLLNKFLK